MDCTICAHNRNTRSRRASRKPRVPARHSHLQGFVLPGLPLDVLPQGFGSDAPSPRLRRAAGIPARRRRSVSDCADNLFKASVNCLSNSVIQLPHSLDRAGRSAGPARIVQRPRWQHHDPLSLDLQERDPPGVHLHLRERPPGFVDVVVQFGDPLDPGLDAPRQPPHPRPASDEDAEPKTQAYDEGPEPRLEQQLAHPPGRLLRIALDCTQRVPRDAPRVRAEPPELARGQLLDLPAFALQPSLEPLGQIVRARTSLHTVLLFSRHRSPVSGSSAVR